MTPDEMRERWAKLERGETIAPLLSSTERPVLYRPLSDSIDDYVHWAQHPDERIYFGFPDLDEQVRGVAPSEMCLINGFSHSGKTLFLLQVLVANRDKTVVYFCPDEPKTLTLIKLASLVHRIEGRYLERLVSDNDPEGLKILHDTAHEWFPHLAVFDQFMSLSDMEKAMIEVDKHVGQPALMVFDYLELMSGDETVPAKANSIKAFGKRHDIPLIVLHQSSRTAGADGKKQTISSGAFGGEQQASHVIGVRRKKFEVESQMRDIIEKIDKSTANQNAFERLDILRYEERLHENTITVNLVKCKRQDAQLLDDIDFEIENGTGCLLRVGNSDTVTKEPETEIQNIAIDLDDW